MRGQSGGLQLLASLLAIPMAAETLTVQHTGVFGDGGAYTTEFTFGASAVDDLVITEDEIISFTAATTDDTLGDDVGLFPGFVYDASNSTIDNGPLSAFVFISLNLVSPGVYEVDDEIVLSQTFYRIVTNDDARSLNLGLLLDDNEPRSTFETAQFDQDNGFRESNDGSWTQIVVPEPTSAALLGLGGLFLISRRRKQIKAVAKPLVLGCAVTITMMAGQTAQATTIVGTTGNITVVDGNDFVGGGGIGLTYSVQEPHVTRDNLPRWGFTQIVDLSGFLDDGTISVTYDFDPSSDQDFTSTAVFDFFTIDPAIVTLEGVETSSLSLTISNFTVTDIENIVSVFDGENFAELDKTVTQLLAEGVTGYSIINGVEQNNQGEYVAAAPVLTIVPEPTSLTLLTFAGMGLIVRRHRS